MFWGTGNQNAKLKAEISEEAISHLDVINRIVRKEKIDITLIDDTANQTGSMMIPREKDSLVDRGKFVLSNF
jgi:hypothetical protein